jgi:hypothetical protein
MMTRLEQYECVSVKRVQDEVCFTWDVSNPNYGQ